MRIWRVAFLLIATGNIIPAPAQSAPVDEAPSERKRPEDDANTDAVVRDQSGVLRHLRHRDHHVNAESLDVSNPTARRLADAYLRKNAAALSLPDDWLVLDEFSPDGLSNAPTKIQFVEQKSLGNATTVSYVQTHLGLAVWQAGIVVTIVGKERPYVVSVTNSASLTIKLKKPEGEFRFPAKRPTAAELAKVLGVEEKRLRINDSRLIIYRYRAKERTLPQPDRKEARFSGFESIVPALPLPPVPDTIREEEYRVVNDVIFTLPVEAMGDVNWRVFVDLMTGSVLYLRPGVSFATGLVFPSDPITISGDPSMTPLAAFGDLNRLRSPPVLLQGLAPPVGGIQALTSSGNTYATISEKGPPSVTSIMEKPTPFEFSDSVETDDFAAISAYYHSDAAFRLVESFGIDVKLLFDGTRFPVPVDHRAVGNAVNAVATVNPSFDGSDGFLFGRAAATSKIGISADWRVVLHEFCHALLWDSTHAYTLPFAESGGDSLAAIINDPNSRVPDRFLTFPWIPVLADRRHDRPVSGGWGWDGIHAAGTLPEDAYNREQILSTTLFRMYRAVGGDDPCKNTKTQGARCAANLIVRGLGLLNPYTPTDRPEILESAMIAADKSTESIDGSPGGAIHKVIRWSFAKQGLHRPLGSPTDTEGAQPEVDVYIDDGRHGDYLPYLVDWTQTADIWNRTSPDGGSVHQTPARFQRNYIYVLVKNRGTQVAKDVSVRTYHRVPGANLVWPSGLQSTTTAVLPLAGDPPISIPSGGQRVVGPFSWYPALKEDQLLATVSASNDLSNIDPTSPLPVNAGPTSLSRLVPFDNNIAQREVHPVPYCEGRRPSVRGRARCTNPIYRCWRSRSN
jgi:hypothetical protein